jgi:hypothetical protein
LMAHVDTHGELAGYAEVSRRLAECRREVV